MALEEPSYQVVQTYPELELRRYAPYLVAETEVSGDFDEVGNQAFRILADYIFGNNRAREKMEMTAPVNQQPARGESDKIEMTAPVTQRPTDGSDSCGCGRSTAGESTAPGRLQTAWQTGATVGQIA